MGKGLDIQFLSYEDIRTRAEDFLQQHHPAREIPIPIEEIIEFQMGINIVPLPGLHQVLEVDGFTSSNLSSIFVDEFMYESRPARYRFTLAHEIGHVVLHNNIYAKASFGSTREWKDFINTISEQDHSWLEYQAYAFGGLVLVPCEHLKSLTKKYINYIDTKGISLEESWDYAWDYMAAQLAKDFEVSTQVIDKRLTNDQIREQYRKNSK